MFCAHCGTQIDNSAAFCPSCGEPIILSSEKAVTAEGSPLVQPEAPLMPPPPAKPKPGGKLRSIVTALTVIAILSFIVYSMQKHPVGDLKNIRFDSYGDMTFGEAVSDSLRNVSWDSEKLDKTRYRVTVHGFCPEEYSHISVTVDMTYADDSVYASVNSITIDEESYDDFIMVPYVMNMVYGE